ncbi:hypothetical protein HJC23_001387 [Cyclotella cryptica]|uniref:Aminotransferase class I/classII large domain-containing protein n=1 Tax=Cyclotella cryptica TaxID=29204 RepID=A0ABD3P9T6_9STRA|eukprot:CCRYP_016738-RA/>CCRYP_016738-RA protein AED:0.04 eAED:0.04 QI:2889/1/1/1/0.33/0.25/4/2436/668
MPPPPHATSLAPSSTSIGPPVKSWTNTAMRALASFLGGSGSSNRTAAAVVDPSNERDVRMGFAMGIPTIISRGVGCDGGVTRYAPNQLLAFAPFPRGAAGACSTWTAGKLACGARTFSTAKDSVDGAAAPSPSKLSSSRARRATSLLPSYLIDARSIQKYDAVSCPEGALQLSVAENQLCERPLTNVKLIRGDENDADGKDDATGFGDLTLMDVLSSLASSSSAKPSSLRNGDAFRDDIANAQSHVFHREMVYYQPTQGTPALRKIMAQYLQNLLMDPITPGSSTSVRQFHADNLVLGAGCNAVLENLCMCLSDPGDAVLVPTPYYAAFEFDLGARAGCPVVPVNTMQFHSPNDSRGDNGPIPAEWYYPNTFSLDHAYARAVKETGRPPRILLLSHPNNPLGVCYPPAVVKECIDWCREREVHLISDEIYAGSVYKTTHASPITGEPEATFVSAMSLASNHSPSSTGLGLGPYVHLVYALSKDFALSGLRVGVAYTENDEILFALQKLNDFCQISSHTQLLVERMLTATVSRRGNATPEQFVDVYLEANCNNIQYRSEKLMSCLNELDIPYLSPDSGLFLWMDLREFLPPLSITESSDDEALASKEQRERELYLSLMKEYGLLFTPGMSMRNEKAGFFRCVFTAASDDEFELGLVRIRKFVEGRRGGK